MISYIVVANKCDSGKSNVCLYITMKLQDIFFNITFYL